MTQRSKEGCSKTVGSQCITRLKLLGSKSACVLCDEHCREVLGTALRKNIDRHFIDSGFKELAPVIREIDMDTGDYFIHEGSEWELTKRFANWDGLQCYACGKQIATKYDTSKGQHQALDKQSQKDIYLKCGDQPGVFPAILLHCNENGYVHRVWQKCKAQLATGAVCSKCAKSMRNLKESDLDEHDSIIADMKVKVKCDMKWKALHGKNANYKCRRCETYHTQENYVQDAEYCKRCYDDHQANKRAHEISRKRVNELLPIWKEQWAKEREEQRKRQKKKEEDEEREQRLLEWYEGTDEGMEAYSAGRSPPSWL